MELREAVFVFRPSREVWLVFEGCSRPHPDRTDPQCHPFAKKSVGRQTSRPRFFSRPIHHPRISTLPPFWTNNTTAESPMAASLESKSIRPPKFLLTLSPLLRYREKPADREPAFHILEFFVALSGRHHCP